MSETRGPGVVRPGEHTADGVPIVDGMRVWTNDLRPGRIDLSDAEYERNHNTGRDTLWFRVVEDRYPDSRGELQSSDRVCVRHPGTGAQA